MKQTEKDRIIDAASELEFHLIINGKKHEARLSGRKLDFPFVWTRDELGKEIDCNITWQLASRIANKETNIINY